jgi:hypothetical protein
MIKSILTFFFSFLSFCLFAQSDSVYAWNKWCARKDTLLLFNGGNNTIQVYCQGLKPADFTLKSLDKSLRIGNPEVSADTVSVLAMPYPAKNKLMRMAVINNKTKKTIKTLNFISDSIPAPEAQLGNIPRTESYKKFILTQTKLIAVFPGSLYSYPYKIAQYSFRIKSPKPTPTIQVSGFFLPTTVIKAISEAPEGSMMEFSDIKATCPECGSRSLDNLLIKIK